jgi:ribose transport system permease protein
LGGTLLSGGKISVVGTFLGGILMVLINNALVLWGVSSYAIQTFIGIILLVAYEIDRTRVNVMKKQSQAAMQKEGK